MENKDENRIKKGHSNQTLFDQNALEIDSLT